MTTQEKVVGMVQEGREASANLPGFFKRVSEFFILQQEQWNWSLVERGNHFQEVHFIAYVRSTG
jgi:hypothetical protein